MASLVFKIQFIKNSGSFLITLILFSIENFLLKYDIILNAKINLEFVVSIAVKVSTTAIDNPQLHFNAST